MVGAGGVRRGLWEPGAGGSTGNKMWGVRGGGGGRLPGEDSRGVCTVLDDCDSQHLTGLAAASGSLPDLNPEYSLEGLKLKLQYFGHLIRRVDFIRKDPDAGKD